MTHIYFVRHAQPEHDWLDDRSRPLTEAGIKDSERVCEMLQDIHLDYAVSSPYKRSIDTIRQCADYHGLEIHNDERFRERQKGLNGNVFGMFQKRWADFEFHEEGGESLRIVQDRNMEALLELLANHRDESILFGTHGTALSTILNYYDRDYGCEQFLRMIDYMPYIIRLDFDGSMCLGREELLIVEKEYRGKGRADIK